MMVEEMDAFLAETANKKHLLDIGALHGIFSLVFAAKDPSRNALAECAVTEAPGRLLMHYEWEHAVVAGTMAQGRTLEVVADSGDNICGARGFSPDVIKIDVEGHEIKVLRGLKETIRRCCPTVFLEIYPRLIAMEGDTIAEIETIFDAMNYSGKRVDGRTFPWSSLRDLVEDERLVLSPNTA